MTMKKTPSTKAKAPTRLAQPKKALTPAELEARKQRWWGAERNERRRQRYQNDPEYRERQILQVRESYRRKRETEGLDVREGDCRENLPLLKYMGQTRDVRVSVQTTAPLLTFTFDELGKAFGRNPQVLYRWLRTDLFPAPLYMARNERNRWQAVYTEAEVKALINEFGFHQQTSQYYSAFHADTRERLFTAAENVRKRFATKYGAAPDEQDSDSTDTDSAEPSPPAARAAAGS